jgi:hypothetical protein
MEAYTCSMGIFEMHNTTSVAMENQVKVLPDSFDLLDKVITYVKDEGSKFKFLDFNVDICCYLLSISISWSICEIMFWPCYVKGMSICS